MKRIIMALVMIAACVAAVSAQQPGVQHHVVQAVVEKQKQDGITLDGGWIETNYAYIAPGSYLAPGTILGSGEPLKSMRIGEKPAQQGITMRAEPGNLFYYGPTLQGTGWTYIPQPSCPCYCSCCSPTTTLWNPSWNNITSGTTAWTAVPLTATGTSSITITSQ